MTIKITQGERGPLHSCIQSSAAENKVGPAVPHTGHLPSISAPLETVDAAPVALEVKGKKRHITETSFCRTNDALMDAR